MVVVVVWVGKESLFNLLIDGIRLLGQLNAHMWWTEWGFGLILMGIIIRCDII